MLHPVHILLVEDNEGDILLTLEAFEESKIKSKISVVRNGQEALDFLYKKAGYEQESSYVIKPIEMEEFLKAILKIEEFWLQLCKLAD